MCRSGSAIVLSSIVLLAASAASAQPLHSTVETLEWMTADSPVIVRGTVADFVREVDDTGVVWNTVVVKVRETLKGQHKPFRTFVIENPVYRDDLPRWKEAKQEILIFLVSNDRLKRAVTRLKGTVTEEQYGKLSLYELTPRFISYGRHALIELADREKSGGLGNAYTLDLRELTKPQDILQHTRNAISAAPREKRVRSHLVRWPAMGAVTLDRVVPIDDRLEAEARKWTGSGDRALREEGAKALQYFPADENVAILKKLLEDPFYLTHVKEKDGTRIETAREYPVRRAAFASLKHLGIKVPKPAIRVRLPLKKNANHQNDGADLEPPNVGPPESSAGELEPEQPREPEIVNDLSLLRRTTVLPQDPPVRASSGEAMRAAAKIFRRLDFVGMDRSTVLWILGDPATVSDYGVPQKEGEDASLVYVFDSGYGGMAYKLRFKTGKVVEVVKQGLH